MPTKTSAHYQREYRKRLREQGLIKREVWIRPENTRLLSLMEKQLRVVVSPEQAGLLAGINQKTGVTVMAENIKTWTTSTLFGELKEADVFAGGRASIEVIDGVEQAIHIVMHDYGDLPIFLTVAGEQIIAEAVLWSASEIADLGAFNEAVLKTHKYFPLSTISLDTMGDGKDYYHMFGALSSTSLLHNVVFEIEVLASNVLQATSAYSEFLRVPIEAR
ncbi:MAG: YjfI family protein [Cellvibrionaceae bacterium]